MRCKALPNSQAMAQEYLWLPRPEPREHRCQTIGCEAHKFPALLIRGSPVIQGIARYPPTMQALDRPVAPGRKRHAVAEDPVRMLRYNRTDPIYASPQIGPGQIPEIVGSQPVKSVERLGALTDAQSGHGKMLLSQVEQAVTTCFVFM